MTQRLTSTQLHALTADLRAEADRLRQSNAALCERAQTYLHLGLPLVHVLDALGIPLSEWEDA